MDRRTRSRRLASRLASGLAAVALVLALAASLWPPDASALPPAVEQAKDQGLVGEQADGYLGFVVNDVPPAVRQAVNEINAQRRELYEKRAAEQGTEVRTYSAVVGKQLIERESSGRYVRAGNAWVKKK